MEHVKQWEIKGFESDISKKLEVLLLNENYSYLFHFRSIPWYQIRRIKVTSPSILKKIVLEKLKIQIEIEVVKDIGDVFSKWIIKPMKPKGTHCLK